MSNTPPVQNKPPTPTTPNSETINTPSFTQTPVQPQTPKNKKPWLLITIIALLLSATSVLGYKYYELQQKVSNLQQPDPQPSPKIVVSSPSPVTSPTTEVDPTAGWKTYTDTTYSFKYPSTWTVRPGNESEEEYWSGDFVEIISPAPTVTINISPSQSLYGFGGPIEHKKGETLNIQVNGKIFQGIETIRVESSRTKVFVDMAIPINNKEFHILFGTGYPANQDDSASYSDYLKYRDTIVQLLSTLKINN